MRRMKMFPLRNPRTGVNRSIPTMGTLINTYTEAAAPLVDVKPITGDGGDCIGFVVIYDEWPENI